MGPEDSSFPREMVDWDILEVISFTNNPEKTTLTPKSSDLVVGASRHDLSSAQ